MTPTAGAAATLRPFKTMVGPEGAGLSLSTARRRSPDQPLRPWDWSAMRAICLREAQRVLGPSASAEDAAQEAMVRAWRRQNTCHTPERPHAWITTIARREALRHVRRPSEACLEDLPSRAHPRTEPEETLVQGATVRQAVAGLKYEDRWLVHGRYWQDLSDEELADKLGLAEPTVRVRLHRLRSSLKEALTEI